MKKCLYCAELIQDEAIVCRYCGRELIDDVEGFVKRQETQENSKQSISVEQLFWQLCEVWAQSHTCTPSGVFSKLESILVEENTTISLVLYGSLLDSGKMTAPQIKELSKANAAIFIQTVTLCSAVGVELGLKYVSEDEVPYLLMLIDRFYMQRIDNVISALIKFGQIKKSDGPDLKKKIEIDLFKIYVRVTNLGSIYCEEVKMKKLENGKSPFINYLLKNLSESGFVEEM